MHEDLYTDVTARIIAALEQGVAPWARPWSTGIDTLPMNAGTRRPYRGVFVEVAVMVQGITLSQIHPVLDGKNCPLAEPTAFDINTSIQRCLVKAIALHGLGLYVYSGEDLPSGEEEAKSSPKVTPIQSERLITPAQLRYLKRLIEAAKSTEGHIRDYFNLERLEDLPMKEFDRALQALRRAA
jgi:hypothetical protein